MHSSVIMGATSLCLCPGMGLHLKQITAMAVFEKEARREMRCMRARRSRFQQLAVAHSVWYTSPSTSAFLLA